MAIGAARCRTPALTTRPQQTIETQKAGQAHHDQRLAPAASDAVAQIGEENAHSSADSEKIAATIGSGMPI